jgi:tripartite-type tricarboxylate transporter receptor subunit TctC
MTNAYFTPFKALGRRALLCGLSVALGGWAIPGSAQITTQPGALSFPTRPIRLVVPYPPGGPLDLVARALAEKLREPLGQAVLVDNRPGAGGNIGAEQVAKSAGDGYTLLLGAVATHAINPYLYAKIGYDPNRDFTPITRLATVPNVLVMNPERAKALNLNSTSELIAYLKRHPGQLNYASGGNGSAGHLAGELFKATLGVSMVHIAYSGAAPAQLALVAGQVDLMFDNLASAAPQIRANRLKAFALTTEKRSSFFPELPTLHDTELKGFDISTWFGVFAPAKLPSEVATKLHQQIVQAMDSPELKARLATMGADTATMSSSDFARFILSEQLKYQRVIKSSGAKID